MKLSEAIRLGAMMTPQSFDAFGDTDGTCALGAAADAIGDLREAKDARWFSERFTWVRRVRGCMCPASCGGSGVDTLGVIVHLNDSHKWTREAIADWLDTLEPSKAEVITPELESVTE